MCSGTSAPSFATKGARVPRAKRGYDEVGRAKLLRSPQRSRLSNRDSSSTSVMSCCSGRSEFSNITRSSADMSIVGWVPSRAAPPFPWTTTPRQSVNDGGARCFRSGPGATRTRDLLLRRQALYPTELRTLGFGSGKLASRGGFRNRCNSPGSQTGSPSIPSGTATLNQSSMAGNTSTVRTGPAGIG